MAGDFARECEQTAQALRRVPAELRRALGKEVKTTVADPLATKIRSAASGPWGRVLSAGTKARAGADPTIVVGGKTPRLSGGGGPRSVVYGVEFGGGKRLSAIPSRPRRRGYRRFTTRQFARNRRPFVFRTIEANMPKVLDAYAETVTRVIGEEIR